MPFLGTTPTQGFVSSFPKQSFTPNGSTTVFTLTNPVASANDLEVFVGNVRQEPTTAYTAAGTTLTMSEAPATGLNFYVINKSFAQVTTTPPANSISTDKIISNAVTSAKIANSAITDAKIAGISTSKFSYNAGDVVQQVHTSVQDYPHPSNPNGHINSDSGIIETTGYSSSSLTPLIQLAVTKKITASKLIVNLTGRFNITTGYRSQIALFDTYTAGQANNTSLSIGYHHYGLYNSTGGNYYNPGSYEYAITGISAGTTKTYYWFGGSIGSGTQRYNGLTMTITEIAT